MSPERKTEDEWFARNERELLKGFKRERERRQAQIAKHLQEEAARKQKELHWMKCPKCGHDMVEHKIDDLVFDKCTLCEGIFMDRSEFEDLGLKTIQERKNFSKRLLHLFKP